jgi:hypothetical protein
MSYERLADNVVLGYWTVWQHIISPWKEYKKGFKGWFYLKRGAGF